MTYCVTAWIAWTVEAQPPAGSVQPQLPAGATAWRDLTAAARPSLGALVVGRIEGDLAAARGDARVLIMAGAAVELAAVQPALEYAAAAAWLQGRGLTEQEVLAALGPLGGRTRAQRLDSLVDWLRQRQVGAAGLGR